MLDRRRLIPIAVAVAAATVPSEALAHGLHAEGDRSVAGYVTLGIRHMVGGWDHLLFIAGIVVLAGSARLAAKLISVFVLGHSLTLLIATLAGWQINAELVDAVIAASVAFIGWRILRGKPDRWLRTAVTIFAFGLAHGLGLATRLQAIELPSGGALVARVLAFNAGVEIGQLAALMVLILLGLALTRVAADVGDLSRVTAQALLVTGALAACVLSFLAVKPEESDAEPPPASTAACTERPFAPVIKGPVGGPHPDRVFFAPGDPLPDDMLDHMLLDGLVVVTYRPALSETDRKQLEAWANRQVGVLVAPGTPRRGAAVGAQTRVAELSCDGVSPQALSGFRDAWFAD